MSWVALAIFACLVWFDRLDQERIDSQWDPGRIPGLLIWARADRQIVLDEDARVVSMGALTQPAKALRPWIEQEAEDRG